MDSLFGITKDYLAIADAIEEQGGEIFPEQEEALNITKENFVQKAQDYNGIMQYNDMIIGEAKLRIEQLKKLIDARNKMNERLEGNLLCAFDAFGVSEVKMQGGGRMRISTYKAVEIVCEEQLNERFIVRKESCVPDKRAIRAAIEGGEDVEGAVLKESRHIRKI